MPQTYRTRHLTAGEHKFVDALEASSSPRQWELAAKLRPPAQGDPDAPPKPRRGRPPKVRPPADHGADDIENG